MRTGPENTVKAKVKKLLDAHKIFHIPIAASPYGVGGISDRLAVLPNGKLLAIECKAPGKKPTRLQEEFLRGVAKNNGIALVIDGDKALEGLKGYLVNRYYEHDLL